jgi:hypothetical protein
MKKRPRFGAHHGKHAVFWYALTLLALVSMAISLVKNGYDVFEFFDSSLLPIGLFLLGCGYVFEDLWMMTKRIHSYKYPKDGSTSYFVSSRVCSILSMLLLTLFVSNAVTTCSEKSQEERKKSEQKR